MDASKQTQNGPSHRLVRWVAGGDGNVQTIWIGSDLKELDNYDLSYLRSVRLPAANLNTGMVIEFQRKEGEGWVPCQHDLRFHEPAPTAKKRPVLRPMSIFVIDDKKERWKAYQNFMALITPNIFFMKDYATAQAGFAEHGRGPDDVVVIKENGAPKWFISSLRKGGFKGPIYVFSNRRQQGWAQLRTFGCTKGFFRNEMLEFLREVHKHRNSLRIVPMHKIAS